MKNTYPKHLIAVMLLRYDTKNAVAVVKDVTNIDKAECLSVFAISPGRVSS